jgi:hypothetical protein
LKPCDIPAFMPRSGRIYGLKMNRHGLLNARR